MTDWSFPLNYSKGIPQSQDFGLANAPSDFLKSVAEVRQKEEKAADSHSSLIEGLQKLAEKRDKAMKDWADSHSKLGEFIPRGHVLPRGPETKDKWLVGGLAALLRLIGGQNAMPGIATGLQAWKDGVTQRAAGNAAQMNAYIDAQNQSGLARLQAQSDIAKETMGTAQEDYRKGEMYQNQRDMLDTRGQQQTELANIRAASAERIKQMSVDERMYYESQKTPEAVVDSFIRINGDTPENRMTANSIAFSKQMRDLAQKNLSDEKAKTEAATRDSRVKEIQARTGLAGSRASQVDEMTRWLPDKNRAEIEYKAAQTEKILSGGGVTVSQKRAAVNSEIKAVKDAIKEVEKSLKSQPPRSGTFGEIVTGTAAEVLSKVLPLNRRLTELQDLLKQINEEALNPKKAPAR